MDVGSDVLLPGLFGGWWWCGHVGQVNTQNPTKITTRRVSNTIFPRSEQSLPR